MREQASAAARQREQNDPTSNVPSYGNPLVPGHNQAMLDYYAQRNAEIVKNDPFKGRARNKGYPGHGGM